MDFQKAVHILSEENNLTKDLILENLRRSHEGNFQKLSFNPPKIFFFVKYCKIQKLNMITSWIKRNAVPVNKSEVKREKWNYRRKP